MWRTVFLYIVYTIFLCAAVLTVNKDDDYYYIAAVPIPAADQVQCTNTTSKQQLI